MKCINCGKPATYIRYTQFAGDHPFCESCAKKQSDFGTNDTYEQWEKIKMKKQKKILKHNEPVYPDLPELPKSNKKYCTVKINISNDALLALMIMAHEQDITFNKLCENILRQHMNVK